MKTKLGEINITNNLLQVIDLHSLELSHLMQKSLNINNQYSFCEFEDSNLFRIHLENKTYRVYGIASKNQYQTWDELIIEINNSEIYTSKKVGELYVDSASLVISDYNIINHWKTKSIDGMTDIVCWGSHAPKIANKLNLIKKGSYYYWYNIPIEDVNSYLNAIKKKKKFWYELKYLSRPHTHKNIIENVIETSNNNIAKLAIGLNNLISLGIHQDGIWPISLDFSKDNKLSQIRISFNQISS